MLQQSEPQDFVIATGEQHTVRAFVDLPAQELGIALTWEGAGVEERGYDCATDKWIVAVAPYFGSTEVATPLGNPPRAHERLGWRPEITFAELARDMVREDTTQKINPSPFRKCVPSLPRSFQRTAE